MDSTRNTPVNSHLTRLGHQRPWGRSGLVGRVAAHDLTSAGHMSLYKKLSQHVQGNTEVASASSLGTVPEPGDDQERLHQYKKVCQINVQTMSCCGEKNYLRNYLTHRSPNHYDVSPHNPSCPKFIVIAF